MSTTATLSPARYAAIPTLYKGVQFRSRTEAAWAAYLDRRGADWRYEPIDLNGYIPDFFVRSEPGRDWMTLEVKGAAKHKDDQVFLDAMHKVEASGATGSVVVVGMDPMVGSWLGHPVEMDGCPDGCCPAWIEWVWDFMEFPLDNAKNPEWRAAKNDVQWKGKRRASR